MVSKIKNDNYSLGPNLRRLRTEHHFSQEEVCRRLQLNGYGDIYRSMYAKYEMGERNSPVRLLVYLTRIYQCTFNDFFEGLQPEDPDI